MGDKFRLLLLISFLAFTGCNDIPRPFAQAEVSRLLIPPSIIYLPAIVNVGPGFMDELEAALTQFDIPVSRKLEEKNNRVLNIALDQLPLANGFREVTLDFTLHEVTGEISKSGILVLNLPPRSNLAVTLARNLYDAMAEEKIIKPVVKVPLIFLHSITSAPGSGADDLAKAIKETLPHYGLGFTDDISAAMFRINCDIKLKPAENKQEEISLAWAVQDKRGKKLAVIEQQSLIAAGSLSNKWGGAAFDIANEVIKGIISIRP